MNILRKSIGVLILIFIGVPTLIAMIWCVGITRAVVSRDFISKLPVEIMEKLPPMIDEVLQEAVREDVAKNPETRAWLKAINNAKTSPKELMEKIGLKSWVENELSGSLNKMSAMINGDEPIRSIRLNLIPLKQSLKHEAITAYLVDILQQLPNCDEQQQLQWENALTNPSKLENLPACKPIDITRAAEAIRSNQLRSIDEIPDSVDLMKSPDHSFPEGLNVARSIKAISFILFLIPAIFIVIASWIGGMGRTGFFKWMGISTLIGGSIGYFTAVIMKNIVPWMMGIGASQEITTTFEKMMMGKVNTIGMMVTDRLFGGVQSVAGLVCVVGITFFALSLLLNRDDGDDNTHTPNPKSEVQQPSQPSQPSHPVSTVQAVQRVNNNESTPDSQPVLEAEIIDSQITPPALPSQES